MFAKVLAVLMGKKENFMQTFTCFRADEPGLRCRAEAKSSRFRRRTRAFAEAVSKTRHICVAEAECESLIPIAAGGGSTGAGRCIEGTLIDKNEEDRAGRRTDGRRTGR
ncbi:hypothetical protein INR49_017970 [Caranx melampygus]|nr:hypothetical protein INR49_017970 [Caranx melampygus]